MGLQPGLWEWDGTWGCSQGLWPGDGTGPGPLAVGMARDTGVPPSKATAATRQASAELQKSPGPVHQEQRVSAVGRYLRYLPPAVPPPQELVFALSWCREAGNSLSHAVRRGASASCSCGCLACSGRVTHSSVFLWEGRDLCTCTTCPTPGRLSIAEWDSEQR